MEPNRRRKRFSVVRVTARDRPSDTTGVDGEAVASTPQRPDPHTAAGDEPAAGRALVHTVDFEAFCAREHQTLARALALALGDRELGRDAAAEALTRAWSRWSSVSQMDNPAGWVYRVGLNWGRSRLRRWRREDVTAFPPDLGASTAEYDDRLAAALATLSPEHRSVVVARFYLDWSEAATADALDIPPGTVKSRLSRALSQLDHRLRIDR
jgi:RNA polymerase sigma-70 factor (ECF subfamily)